MKAFGGKGARGGHGKYKGRVGQELVYISNVPIPRSDDLNFREETVCVRLLSCPHLSLNTAFFPTMFI
jgi:hypothetical protein